MVGLSSSDWHSFRGDLYPFLFDYLLGRNLPLKPRMWKNSLEELCISLYHILHRHCCFRTEFCGTLSAQKINDLLNICCVYALRSIIWWWAAWLVLGAMCPEVRSSAEEEGGWKKGESGKRTHMNKSLKML